MNTNNIFCKFLCFSLIFLLALSSAGLTFVWAEENQLEKEPSSVSQQEPTEGSEQGGGSEGEEWEGEEREGGAGSEEAETECGAGSEAEEGHGAEEELPTADDPDSADGSNSADGLDSLEEGEPGLMMLMSDSLGDEEIWQLAWINAKNAGNAKAMEAVFTQLGDLATRGIGLTKTGLEDGQKALYSFKNDFGGANHTVADFKDAVYAAVLFGVANDLGYYGDSFSLYLSALRTLNYRGFNDLSEEEQWLITANIRLFKGFYSSSRDINEYKSGSEIRTVYTSSLESLASAVRDDIEGFTDGTASVNLGANKTLNGYTLAGSGHKLIFESVDSAILRAGSGTTMNDGKVYGVSGGKTTIIYLRVNSTTGAISNYGLVELVAYDGAQAAASAFRPEAGRINMMMVTFDKAMNYEIDQRVPLTEVAAAIKVGDTELEELEGEVQWITRQVAKVVFPATDIKVGERVELTFAPQAQTASSVTMDGVKVISGACVADKSGPVGKIVAKTGSQNQVEVIFNELIAEELKSAEAGKVIRAITLGADGAGRRQVSASALSWNQRDGRDVMVIHFADSVSVGATEFFTVEYTDYLRDFSGNVITAVPAAYPIGGSMGNSGASIMEAMREAAGGKTPQIGVAASTGSSYAYELEYFQTATGLQSAYGLASLGIEPIHVDVSHDTYNDDRIIELSLKQLEDCTGFFMPGGDQSRAARSYLNDDGSDTELMRQIRQIYHGGGVIAGSSAGDHALSDPMIIAGDNGGAHITSNRATTLAVHEYNSASSGSAPSLMTGLGIIRDIGLTDSHFDARNRLPRLLVAMRYAEPEQTVGIGVSEDTGILIENGIGTVYGSSFVLIADTRNAEFPESSIYAVRNLRLSILTSGDQYDFNDNKVISSKPAASGSANVSASTSVFTASGYPQLMRNLVRSQQNNAYGTDGSSGSSRTTVVLIQDNLTEGYYSSNSSYAVGNMLVCIDQYGKLEEMRQYTVPIEPPVSQMFRLEAGMRNTAMVTFDRPMDFQIDERIPLTDFADEIAVNGESIGSLAEGEVIWITKQVAKVIFPAARIQEGDVFTLTYNKETVKSEDGAAIVEDLEAEPCAADLFGPVGKIVPQTGVVDGIEIVFNELISTESKAVTETDAVISAIAVGEGDACREVTPVDLSWSVRDGRDVLTVGIQPVTVEATEYFQIAYTDIIRDFAGNPIDARPKAVAIGGGINLGAALSGTTEILNNIRELAGGGTPKVAILSSSDSPYEDAWDYFYENASGVQTAYGFALFGFEPVIAEITCDTYDDPEIIKKTMKAFEDCTAVFGPGGDQAMNSRSYLNDDGSDTELMRAMRQVFHSGGVISGSSAGDHSLSNPMITGGVSGVSIIEDRVDVITVDDYANMGGNVPLIIPGFGFVSQYGLTDSHVDARGRFGRLLVALKHTGQKVGIGVAENTAISIVDGIGTVYGAGGVTISDTSAAEFVDSDIYAARGIRVSHLTSGDQYDFAEKEVRSEKPVATESDRELTPSVDVFPGSISDAHQSGVEALMRELITSTASYHYGTDGVPVDETATLVFLKDQETKGYYRSDEQFAVSNLVLHVDTYARLEEMENPEKFYTVTVETPQNGTITSPDGDSRYLPGETVKLTAQPSGGYRFSRWQVVRADDRDENITVASPTAAAASFVMPDGDVIVSAAFSRSRSSSSNANQDSAEESKQAADDPDGEAVLPEDETSKPQLGIGSSVGFIDVGQDHWAYQSVKHLLENGYVAGKTESEFAPDDSITRAEFITILARMSHDAMPPSYQGSLEDVQVGSYYESAVAWATEAGLVTGTSETAFSPERPILRQEMAVMILRYADHKGIALPQGSQSTQFSDAQRIEAYARDAVAVMKQANVINGYEDGSFRPLNGASRAEAALMLTLIDQL